MAIILLVVLLIALSLTALWYRSSYVRALEDQIALANFLMEVLTNDRERVHQQTDFLEFVMKSEFSNAGAMSEVSANRLRHRQEAGAAGGSSQPEALLGDE